MTTARQSNSLPARDFDSKIPASGEYRMVQPRRRAIEMRAVQAPPATESPMPSPMPARRRVSSEYLDMKDGPIAMPIDAKPATVSMPVRSVKPKVIALETLDDAFEDENAPEAPDSLVQMMEGIEGTRVKEEAAWPREMPHVPRPPSVPKMEAMSPPDGALQAPVSGMTAPSSAASTQTSSQPAQAQTQAQTASSSSKPSPKPAPMTTSNEEQVIAAFAKFGPSPESIWQTPGYAFYVRARKEQLKRELGLYRERRPSDVALFEKALRHIDEGAVRRGYMVIGGALLMTVLVIVIVCMLL